MRLFIAFACFLAGCLAQGPYPCMNPPLMSGALSLSTEKGDLTVYVQYIYDAIGERVRLWEHGSYESKAFVRDYVLNYKEGLLYNITDSKQTCETLNLKGDFHPLRIPKTASLLGQAVLGSSSVPGEGLLVNTWEGDLPELGGKFISTVTELGCIPVSTLYHTERYGWVVIGFFNNVIGIPDLSVLNPPNFCPQPAVEPQGEPQDFLSLFLKKN